MTSTTPIRPPNGIDHEPSTGSYSTIHDWESDLPASTCISMLVARIAGVDPVELPPLNEYVDPDALDSLFEPRRDGSARQGGSLTFCFYGHEVTVRSDGEIAVCPH